MDPLFFPYCAKWSADIARIDDEDGRIAYFKGHLPTLLTDHAVIRSILKQMADGRQWPDLKRPGLFSHEVLLYLDASRRFSVRLYFHGPGSHTKIHDHTSWGISGVPFGRLSVICYGYDGSGPKNHVQLRPRQPQILSPGEVTLTKPWNEGIHKTGSGDDAPNVMISVYGRPGRRLYVNQYDEVTGAVERLYPQRILRRKMARETLSLCPIPSSHHRKP